MFCPMTPFGSVDAIKPKNADNLEGGKKKHEKQSQGKNSINLQFAKMKNGRTLSN